MKNEIAESYFKSMREYIFSGLVASQANGSYGEDLLVHFDALAACFRALQIIKEKRVAVDLLMDSFHPEVTGDPNGLAYYNCFEDIQPLTDEEYMLLKGALR